jgi:hypothetical protein
MTLDDVDAFAMGLAGVTVSTRWGHRTWMVGDKGFAWHRPFSKADIKRFGDETPPAGDIVAVMVDGLDAKDALLSIGLPGFFTIPHFNGYAAVLIELKKARAKDVRAAIRDAHRVIAAKTNRKSTRTGKASPRKASPRRPRRRV